MVRGDIYLSAASFILIAFDPFYFCPLFSAENYAQEFFDVLVAIVCVLSLLLCGRSILRGILLQHVRKLATNFCIFFVFVMLAYEMYILKWILHIARLTLPF